MCDSSVMAGRQVVLLLVVEVANSTAVFGVCACR